MKRLDVLAAVALIVLAGSSVLLIAYTTWAGISLRLHTSNPHDQISPRETLILTFSQPVFPEEVEKQLQLQPENMGKLDWQNDHTLRITPLERHRGTLNIRLPSGKFGVNGEWMRWDASWTLTVRPPSIVYLNYAEPKNELMMIPAKGGSPRQLTFTNSKIVSFDVSPSGDSIVYSMANDQQGFDLWLVGRNGQNTHRLLDCGSSRCYSPVWSPDDNFIAYSRDLPRPNNGGGSEYGLSRPWVLNVESTETYAVFRDSQAIGVGAIWSPDGTWLASYDLNIDQIRVINLQSYKEILLPSQSKELGSWSPDSSFFIHSDYVLDENNNISKNFISIVDVKKGLSKTLLVRGSDATNYRYGNPLWSPSGNNIVVSMHSVRRDEIPQLWIFDADNPEEVIMSAVPGYSYDSYQWDAQGVGLLIQQTSLTKAYLYEIATWNPSDGYQVVGKNGAFPRWLP